MEETVRSPRTADAALIRRKRPLSPSRPPAAFGMGLGRPAAAFGMLPALSDLLASQRREPQRLSPIRQSPPVELAPPPPTAVETAEPQEDETDEDKTPWPSAAQYHELFTDAARFRSIPVYDLGVDPRGVPLHPEFIYSQPVSCMYFLKCARLLGKGSFGFPRKLKAAEAPGKKAAGKGRKEPSKEFEWRKMSFVTGLPKKQPVVRYITATCYARATDVAAKKKVFRMHAVMLADDSGAGEAGDYVLVHIRAGGSKRVGLRASLAVDGPEPMPQSPVRGSEPSIHDEFVPVRRPVSPPMAAAPSYNSQAASTSPRNKKRRHAEYAPTPSFGAGPFAGLTPEPAKSATAAVPRHSLFPSTPEDAKVSSARLAMRELILSSCSSRDEVAKYVLGLQEELAALQHQTN